METITKVFTLEDIYHQQELWIDVEFRIGDTIKLGEVREIKDLPHSHHVEYKVEFMRIADNSVMGILSGNGDTKVTATRYGSILGTK